MNTITTEDYRVGMDRARADLQLVLSEEGFSGVGNFVKRFMLALSDYLIAIIPGFMNNLQNVVNLANAIPGINRPRSMVATFKEYTEYQQNLMGILPLNDYVTLFIKTMTDLKRDVGTSSIKEMHREIMNVTDGIKRAAKQHDRHFSGNPTKELKLTFGSEFGHVKNFQNVVDVARSNFKYCRHVGNLLEQTKKLEALCRETAEVVAVSDISKQDGRLLAATMERMGNTISFMGQLVTAEIMVEINLAQIYQDLTAVYRRHV